MSDTPTKPITLGIRPSGYKKLSSIATEHGLSLCDAIEACAIAFMGATKTDREAAVLKQIKQRPQRKRRVVLQL